MGPDLVVFRPVTFLYPGLHAYQPALSWTHSPLFFFFAGSGDEIQHLTHVQQALLTLSCIPDSQTSVLPCFKLESLNEQQQPKQNAQK